MDKKKIIYLILSVVTFLLLLFMATYAYFEGDVIVGNPMNVGIETSADNYVFASSSSGSISVSVNATDMQKDNINTYVSDTGNLNVSLISANSNTLTRCTYDVIWTWDNSSNTYTPDVTLPYTNNNVTYNYEMSIGVTGINGSEKDISKLSNNTILKSEIITSESLTATTKNYEVYVKVYNLPVDQVNIKNKEFTGKVSVTNVQCIMTDIDNEILVYIETGIDTNVYSQTEIDNTKSYEINASKTTCNEATIENHKVSVSEKVGNKCSVYLDRIS